MTKARTLADLLDSSGDVKSSALDNATSSLSDLSITATASELNTLDGITATTAELNYLDGVTSNVQTQIDGISSEVVDDTTPSLGGDLSTNGNDVNFGDNDKAQFGAGNDLQIYHDGSDSYINDTGTGDLKLGGNQLQLNNAAQTKNYLYAVDGAQVELKHNNVKKLETTSNGVKVAGRVEVDQSAAPTLVLDSTATNDTALVAYTSFQRGGSEKAWIGYGTSTNNHFRINQGLNAPLTFYTNGTERMTINGDGTWGKAPAGTILQVKSFNYSSITTSTFSNGGAYDTPVYVDITPKSTTSRMFITAHLFGEFANGGYIYNTPVALKRGSTVLKNSNGSAAGISLFSSTYSTNDADSTPETCAFQYWDAPATTSSVRYRVTLGPNNNAGTLYFYWNRSVNSSTALGYERGISNITVMEVAN